MGRTEGPVSAFLWISKTVSLGAVKRNGFWYFVPKGEAFGFGSFLRKQKVPRQRPWNGLKWSQRLCSGHAARAGETARPAINLYLDLLHLEGLDDVALPTKSMILWGPRFILLGGSEFRLRQGFRLR